MSAPASPLLSPSQLAALAEIGEERSAPVGELLYRLGDRTYPFIAILEGEVAIVDAAGNDLVRHGPSGFLGELNLLSGQTVFVNALATRAAPVHRSRARAPRPLPNEDGPLSNLLLSTFIDRREALQSVQGIGLEIVGPHGSEETHADAGVRTREPAAVHLAGRCPAGRPRSAARANARRRRPAPPQPAARRGAHSGSGSSSSRASRSIS